MIPQFSVFRNNFNTSVLENISKFKDFLTFRTLWKLYNDGNSSVKVSGPCEIHLNAAATQLPQEVTQDLWTLKMIDAWGKFPEGLLSGHIGMMGDFEECMNLNGNVLDKQNVSQPFVGRYCPMHLVIASELIQARSANFQTRTEGQVPLYTIGEELHLLMTQPTLAACLPSACTRDDFNIFFSTVISVTRGIMNPITSYCQTRNKPEYDAAVYGMMAAVAILLLISLIASSLDILTSQNTRAESESKSWKTLMAFSLPTNCSKLLSTDSSDLGCLHGLRFGSICWVILGHTWSILTYSPIWNSFRIGSFHKPWTILTIANGTFCVDTFFALAGFLISYQLFTSLNKSESGNFIPLKLYLHRYLRITPTYAFLIGLIATFQPYISNGPMWGIIDMNSKYCRRNWWQNILYINNLVEHNGDSDPTDIPCFGEAWYLGCDMQFFVVSIWLIYLIWKHYKSGIALLILVTLGSVITPGWIIAAKHLMPTSIPFRTPTGKESGNYDLDVYVKPWTRYGPYVAGIWTGYAYYLLKKTNSRVPRRAAIVGWICSTSIALSILYGPQKFFNIEIPLGRIQSILYGALARFAWGGVIGWIIFACLTGNGGYVNKFLSLKIFVPLGRITFCMFLISYELQQMFHARYPHPISYDVYFLTNLFLAHLTLSICIAFWFTLFIESPFVNLSKIILGP